MLNAALFYSTIRLRRGITLFAGIFFLLINFALAQEITKTNLSQEEIKEIKSKLPPSPQGFSWHFYRNVVLLKPIGWHERDDSVVVADENTASTYIYGTSPQDFDVGKPFDMGFTVEIFSGVKKSPEMNARAIAAEYIGSLLKIYKEEDFLMMDLDKKTEDNLNNKYYLRYHSVPKRFADSPEAKKMKHTIIHKFIMTNNKINNVHVFTFESPEESWESNWIKYGEPIIKNVVALPNVPAE